MRCSSCGQTIPNESNYCNHCGKPVNSGMGGNQQVSPERCALCNGQGQESGFLTNSICSACGGKGSVLVILPAKKCALCHGMGKRSGMFDSSICTACNGSGWAHIVK